VVEKGCRKDQLEEGRQQEQQREGLQRENTHNRKTAQHRVSHEQDLNHPKPYHEKPAETTKHDLYSRHEDNETITKFMKKRVELWEQQSDLVTKQSQLLQQQADLCQLQMEISQQQAHLSQQLSELTQRQTDIVPRRNELAAQISELSLLIDDGTMKQLFLYKSCVDAKHNAHSGIVSTTETAVAAVNSTPLATLRSASLTQPSRMKSEPKWHTGLDDDSDSSCTSFPNRDKRA
jgi:hypothetical protein